MGTVLEAMRIPEIHGRESAKSYTITYEELPFQYRPLAGAERAAGTQHSAV